MSPRVTPEYKEQRRNEILDVARSVFEEQGYNATSMQDISDRCTLSRGAIYQYFENKEDVFLALLKRGDEAWIAKLRILLATSDHARQALEMYLAGDEAEDENSSLATEATGGDGEQTGNRFSAAIFEYNFSVAEDNEVKTARRYERYRRILDAFVEFLQAGVDTGEFHPRFPLNAIADTFLLLQDGVAFTEIGFKPDYVPVKEQERVLTGFLKYALGLN